MDLSWSQTPNSVWWALEASASYASLDSLLGPPSPQHDPNRLLRRDTAAQNFYNFADETDVGQSEDELLQWTKQHHNRGLIRIFQAGVSYSELMRCTMEMTAEKIMAKCFAKELFIHFGSKVVRRVCIDEHPLQLIYKFLEELGYSNPDRMQLEAIREDLAPLFKFVAGQERGNRLEDQVQLACQLKVKELTSIASTWSKRFCVLCGSRMFIFSSARPKGKPSLVLDLRGGKITGHKSKKYFYALKITASRKEVLVAFESRLDQAKWLERASKVVSKHPLEANLSGYSLEKLPKYYFLNSNLIAMNFSHNFMKESFDETDAALLGYPRSIGWISDLIIFHNLVSLSLSDNNLEQFPTSVCSMSSLQELDLSCNKIRIIPQEIKILANLTTLLLHSNQLNALPYHLGELRNLSTLVIAFNKFFELPATVKELPALAILVASGNYISMVPEDINRIQTLRHFDMRLNKLKGRLPQSLEDLPNLMRLNVRGNRISDVNTAHMPYLELLNCTDNSLRTLTINEGPVKIVTAKNNKITQFGVSPTCDNLMSIDISRNELTSLPDSLTKLNNLVKLNAGENKLTKLPSRIFMMEKLQVLQVPKNHLVKLPSAMSDHSPLQQLNLHSNQISSLPSQLLIKTNKLEVLNVSSNQLATFPPLNPVDDFNVLEELYAANNRLKGTALPVIARYHKLKVLHLAYNEIRNIPSGFFAKLNELEYVNLSGNSLSSVPPTVNSPRLQCLLLHSNQLTSLPTFPTLAQLHTVDLACNQFETVPELTCFPRLKSIDLSGNSPLTVNPAAGDVLKSFTHCCLEGVLDIQGDLKSKRPRSRIEIGGTTTHGKWSYGSGQVIGIESSVDCTVQIKSASMLSRGQDAFFAIIDGGRSPAAPEVLRKSLEQVLFKEMESDERELGDGYQHRDALQYIVHTFLTAHRKLQEIGQRFGCSVVLCHIHAREDGSYVLNVGNTGLGEAILCRSGRAVPLTTTHSPATNAQERIRISDSKGFISQDNRVNGVCGASRLVGCFHLWPQIIPAPSTESVELRIGDEHIVMATDGLWKFVSYEQIVHEVRSISDPIRCAKRLRDLTVAHGCNTDVSVIVIKLNIDRGPPAHSALKTRSLKTISEPESERESEEEEELEITNIDDILSDNEDDPSPAAPADNEMMVIDSDIQTDLDRRVLSAIMMPPTSPDHPIMESTNMDDLVIEDISSLQTPMQIESAASTLPCRSKAKGGSNPTDVYSSNHQPIPDGDYIAQTLPKDASASRRDSKLNAGFAILETSFEQTQSVPVLKINGFHREGSEFPVDSQLAALNEVMTQLDRVLAESDEEEEIELKPVAKKGGSNRLSYVEHSFKQLTNDTYSADSLGYTQNTTDLNTWVS